MPMSVPVCAVLPLLVLHAASATAGATNQRDERIIERPFLGCALQRLHQPLGGRQGFSTNGYGQTHERTADRQQNRRRRRGVPPTRRAQSRARGETARRCRGSGEGRVREAPRTPCF